jgi:hypothetical protein
MHRSWLIVLLTAVGCGGGSAAPDAMAPPPPDASPPPDSPPRVDASAMDAAPCQPIPGAPIIEPVELALTSDPAVDIAVALPPSYVTQTVDVGSSNPIVAAAVFDNESPFVVGFWASRDAAGTGVVDDVQGVDDAIAATVLGTGESHVIREGTLVTTDDGFPAWTDREVRVYVYGYRRVASQRTMLLAELFGRDPADFGLPTPTDPNVGIIVLRYSVIRRSNAQSIVIVTAASSTSYENGLDTVGASVRALGGGSVIARFGFYPRERCVTVTATTLARIDLVTSDPSNGDGVCDPGYDCFFEHKAELYGALFDKLATSGLDARVATGAPPVNPLNDYDPNQPLCPGDAFIDTDPANRQAFLDCAAADAEAQPLQNAEWMLERLLPRAEQPNRLRPDAQAVVVLVGAWIMDDQEVSGPDYSLPIGPQEQGLLDIFFLTREQFFLNENVIVDSYVYLGDPSPPCPSVIRFGYPDVALDLGGGAFDVCYEDPLAVAERIIASSVAAASPFVLDERPIVPSLAVVAETGILEPTPADGYEYRGMAENSLIVRGIPLEPATVATIGTTYFVWEEINPP